MYRYVCEYVFEYVYINFIVYFNTILYMFIHTYISIKIIFMYNTSKNIFISPHVNIYVDIYYTIIGFVRMYETTRRLYDMHVETHHGSSPDCTHFIYHPRLFDALWFEIKNVLERFLHYVV